MPRPLPRASSLADTKVPSRFWGCHLKDFEWEPSVVAKVEAYVDALPEKLAQGKGVFFMGSPGSGKTFLAAYVLQAVFAHAEKNTPCFYTTYAAYLRRLRDQMTRESAWGKHSGEVADEVFEMWKTTDDLLFNLRNRVKLLVLDDMGKEHATNSRWAEDEFDDLLRYRYDQGLATVLTSNLPVQEWGLRYSGAMESFLHECCEVVVVGGRDWRA